jgi:hypothetical protein
MKPKIEKTEFGSISVAGETYDYDLLIRLDGSVHKRKKMLSKEIYGTSHKLSLPEAEFVYEDGTQRLIFGSGQYGYCELSAEAEAYFKEKKVTVTLLPTPEAIEEWNQAEGKVIGLFHITC